MFGGCIYWKVAQLIHQQNIQWPLTHILDYGFLDERELLHTSVSFVHPTHMPLISMQPRIQTLPKDFGRCKPYTVRCPYFCVCAFNPRKNSESDLNLPCTSYFDIMQLDMSGPRTMTVSHQAHLSTHSHYYRPPLSLPYENKNKGWLTYHLYVGIITPSFFFFPYLSWQYTMW